MTEHDPKLAFAAENDAQPASTHDFIPEGSPFDEEQRSYLNGLFSGLHALAAARSGEAEEQTPLKVLFGSQTGTAESLCKDIRKFAASKGFAAELAELNSVSPGDLASGAHLLIVAATYGDGEPTDNAAAFHAALMAEDCASLPESLNFSVCGLGDSSYPQFNKVAREIDARLAELGASRAADLVACDVDYDDDYGAWREAVFASAPFEAAAGGGAGLPATETDAPKPGFDKSHPFMAHLLSAQRLSGQGSAKSVNHVEISLCGGGADLEYQVGDALGVCPLNDMKEVDEILAVCGFTGREIVELKSGPCALRQALYRCLDLSTLTAKTAENWGVEVSQETQVIDVLASCDGLEAQALADGLRPLQPRLYSISSSPKKHPGEVHLTVGEVRYELEGKARKGVASTFLGGRLAQGASLGVYVHEASHFHLPADDEVPMIMIGPGTGIAPFRAFLEEREMRAAPGDNWLIFGDQHAASDYLYEDEIEAWATSGLINKLSLAWSRDSAQKVYVQHLIEQDGKQFFDWLERGAAIYICGDATRMAADVDSAIHRVVSTHGGLEEKEAEEYVAQLRQNGRYQRDIY